MPPYLPAGRTSRSSSYQLLGGMPVLITRVASVACSSHGLNGSCSSHEGNGRVDRLGYVIIGRIEHGPPDHQATDTGKFQRGLPGGVRPVRCPVGIAAA